MSPSGDEKFRWQRSTVAVGSPWGGTTEVLFDLADPRVVQLVLEGGFQGVQMSGRGQEDPNRQEVTESVQVGSKERSRGSKLRPRGGQEHPSWAKELPKSLQLTRKRSSKITWRAPGRLSKSIRRAKRENLDF